MNELIANIKPTIELIYFISSSLLLVGVGLAYRQLTLIKVDIELKNQRSSAEKAIEASERYFCEYTELTKQIQIDRKKHNVSSYDGVIGDFSNSSIPSDLREKSSIRFSLSSWLPALNRLEAIAAYFTTGVADESVGFSVIGRTFCSTVELNYDIIARSRSSGAVDYWENIVKLYHLWRPRLSKAELELAKTEAEKKISTLKQNSVPPIGVKRT